MNKTFKYILYVVVFLFIMGLLNYLGVFDLIKQFFNWLESMYVYISLFTFIPIMLYVIWDIITEKLESNKDIKDKVIYMAKCNLKAGIEKENVIGDDKCLAVTDKYFQNEDGIVMIPKYSKCIILEYVKGYQGYVKVQFDDYPDPLFTAGWLLRTPEQMDTLDRIEAEKRQKYECL